ncbi:MAG: ORF6N domain-containing protein [Candidatus Omnitrophica bacterium]|nr:ORF6N domain-containing protein [Candidatus Omnitrophota bacterium]
MPAKRKSKQKQIPDIEFLIKEIRGQRVILDADLAQIYGVATKIFNQAIKRNLDRFPVDFMFRLTLQEAISLRSWHATGKHPGNWSQFVTSSRKHRGYAYLPLAFTEHGAIMAANILNSKRAVQMSVFVVRAFVKMKKIIASSDGLMDAMIALDQRLTGRLDIHETAIVDILRRIMTIIDPPPASPEPPKRRIGFHAD